MAEDCLPSFRSLLIAELLAPLHGRCGWRLTGVFLGALFAQGRQTISRRLRAAGASGDCQRYYCFLSRLGRKTNSAAGRLLARAVERTAPAGRILLALDDSPTKEGAGKSWLWAFVADSFTVFALRTTRAASVLEEMLTDAFGGVVNCDRAKMYWNVGRPQWCWAHLKRDFQALIDHPDPQVQRLGRDLMRPTKELFRHWSRCRDGTITRLGFERLMKPVRQEIDGLLLRGAFGGNPKLIGMCREPYDHRDWLWTFLDVEGIEPTNNASERALRPAVIWRKLSFGAQSAQGGRFVETILTIVETCRRQSKNSFEYLTAALQAHFAGQPPPSLLPGA